MKTLAPHHQRRMSRFVTMSARTAVTRPAELEVNAVTAMGSLNHTACQFPVSIITLN